MPVSGRTLGELSSQAERFTFARRVLLPSARFIRVEETAGWPMIVAACAAMVWMNIWPDAYRAVWESRGTLELFFFSRTEETKTWVSDLLLPLFFFAAGLAIKHELVHGELSTWKKAALPLFAALGGMAVPAGVYVAINVSGGEWRGWGVPVATDIAFALAVLGLLRKRVPQELRVFVLAFAAADDFGGVLVIAFFYTSDLSWAWLGGAAGVLALIVAGRQWGLRRIEVYWVLGAVFVLALLQSGVHPTVAGVVLGLLTPARAPIDHAALAERIRTIGRRITRLHEWGERIAQEERDQERREKLLQELFERENRRIGELEFAVRESKRITERLTNVVNPVSSYVVLPLFALAHGGVEITAKSLGAASASPAAWGVIAALCLGKPIGFLCASWVGVRLGWAQLPRAVGWRQFAGAGVIAGVGFTISLFIAQLAFSGEELPAVKIAVLLASLVAAGGGAAVLLWGSRAPRHDDGAHGRNGT